MATDGIPRTFTELYTDLLNRVRVDTSISATVTQAKRYINIGLYDMHISYWENFDWAERNAILLTQPEYTTGTLAVTQGGTTLTGTSTLWDTANTATGANNMRVGGKIVINGSVNVQEITAIASDTSATIGTRFIDATVTAASYSYFEDEYDLDADFLRPLDQRLFSSSWDIPMIGRNEFRHRYPRNKLVGKPKIATMISKNSISDATPERRIVFFRPPDIVYMIPYSFITNKLAVSSAGAAKEEMSVDTDEPIVPVVYRMALVYHALSAWYRDKKDDDRQTTANQFYVDIVTRVVNDGEIGAKRPRIAPVIGPYKARAKMPYRGGRGRRYITGSAFDELR